MCMLPQAHVPHEYKKRNMSKDSSLSHFQHHSNLGNAFTVAKFHLEGNAWVDVVEGVDLSVLIYRALLIPKKCSICNRRIGIINLHLGRSCFIPSGLRWLAEYDTKR